MLIDHSFIPVHFGGLDKGGMLSWKNKNNEKKNEGFGTVKSINDAVAVVFYHAI